MRKHATGIVLPNVGDFKSKSVSEVKKSETYVVETTDVFERKISSYQKSLFISFLNPAIRFSLTILDCALAVFLLICVFPLMMFASEKEPEPLAFGVSYDPNDDLKEKRI